MRIYKIDAAVVLADLQVSGDTYAINGPNPEYKFCLQKDGVLFASKDGKDYVIAIAAKIGDKEYSSKDLPISGE